MSVSKSSSASGGRRDSPAMARSGLTRWSTARRRVECPIAFRTPQWSLIVRGHYVLHEVDDDWPARWASRSDGRRRRASSPSTAAHAKGLGHRRHRGRRCPSYCSARWTGHAAFREGALFIGSARAQVFLPAPKPRCRTDVGHWLLARTASARPVTMNAGRPRLRPRSEAGAWSCRRPDSTHAVERVGPNQLLGPMAREVPGEHPR